MINKRGLWFLTLFSLILVLSVYYITMPSELLMTANNAKTKEVSKTEKVSKTEETESAELVALRVESEEQLLDEITELKTVLTNAKSSAEEKNKAFEKMQQLNQNRGTEETLEKKIKKEHNLTAFVKINGSDISVVVDSTKHTKALANKIMRTIQAEFDTHVSVSVKFQK
ncbi:MAG: SpoIIIAH-like family protein [Bacilli bacterium]|nr:SpoIIIAH-like family protein [Bacilli bacterium]